MRLVDMSPKKRLEVVGDAITSLLAVATKPLATRKLTELVCAHLDTAEVTLVTAAIMKLKYTHGARATGETFKNAFGRVCQKYAWSAVPSDTRLTGAVAEPATPPPAREGAMDARIAELERELAAANLRARLTMDSNGALEKQLAALTPLDDEEEF